MSMSPSCPITPVRNSIEETWPSPIDRRLTMTRSEPLGCPGLVGMSHDRGVGERGALEGVLVHEVRANEPSHLVGELGCVGNQVRHRQESTLEDCVEVLVPLLEALAKLLERIGNLVGGEFEDPTDQLLPRVPPSAGRSSTDMKGFAMSRWASGASRTGKRVTGTEDISGLLFRGLRWSTVQQLGVRRFRRALTQLPGSR